MTIINLTTELKRKKLAEMLTLCFFLFRETSIVCKNKISLTFSTGRQNVLSNVGNGMHRSRILLSVRSVIKN